MLEDSLRSYGAGRSLLVDKHGVVIAGNKTLEAAASIGLEDIRVVQTDGRTLVVVQRTDLDLSKDSRAKALAIADNRTAQVSLDWDGQVIASLVEDGVDLSGLFSVDELSAVTSAFNVEVAGTAALASGDKQSFQQMTFTLHDDQAETVKAAIDKAKNQGGGDSAGLNENSNGNALAFICAGFVCG